jgi:putative phosphoribosyl transferase
VSIEGVQIIVIQGVHQKVAGQANGSPAKEEAFCKRLGSSLRAGTKWSLRGVLRIAFPMLVSYIGSGTGRTDINEQIEQISAALPSRALAEGREGAVVELPFRDRSEAGRLLGAELAFRKLAPSTIVLALPLGGLPVGAEVAEALKAPLDVVVVRKIGVPWQPELAMGAIAGATQVLDRQLIRELRISDEEVEAIVSRERKEVQRREKLLRGGLPAQDLGGRTVVIVDDGLATGSTMVAASRHVRSAHPERMIIAVPVGSSEGCTRLGREVDECICLAVPQPFLAVGEWYLDFRQVTDQEVRVILKRSHSCAGVAS